MSSIIAALLSWTGLSQGAMELIAIGTVAFSTGGVVWYWHHHVYDTGITAQQAADAAATAKVQAAAEQKTAQLQARATAAETRYATSQAALNALPPVQPVRVCLNPGAGGGSVPKAGAASPGNASAGAPAAGLQPVPAGNPGLRGGSEGPDLSGLLSALAARADQVSATLAEFQARNNGPKH